VSCMLWSCATSSGKVCEEANKRSAKSSSTFPTWQSWGYYFFFDLCSSPFHFHCDIFWRCLFLCPAMTRLTTPLNIEYIVAPSNDYVLIKYVLVYSDNTSITQKRRNFCQILLFLYVSVLLLIWYWNSSSS
jgi:hypothetical protein